MKHIIIGQDIFLLNNYFIPKMKKTENQDIVPINNYDFNNFYRFNRLGIPGYSFSLVNKNPFSHLLYLWITYPLDK